MNNLNLPVLTFFAVVIVGIIVLIAVIRRTPPDQTAVNRELERLTAGIATREEDLRTELSRAAKSEGLAEERKAEIDRLNGDLSKLRMRLDMDRQEQQVLLAAKSGLEAKAESETELTKGKTQQLQILTDDITQLRGRLEQEQKLQQTLTDKIARLETQIKAEKTSVDEKIALLTSVREDMQAKFKQLADDALKSQGETFSKANIEKLEATLTPLKEHVGHFEKELREVHQETVKDRERLKAEITQLSKRSEEISTEAVNLTRALKAITSSRGHGGK